MENKKKSQVTVFIIVGMSILLIVVMFYVIVSEDLTIHSTDFDESLERFIDDCIARSIGSSAFELGENGGLKYKHIPSGIFPPFTPFRSYLYTNSPKRRFDVSRSQLEENFEYLIKKNLLDCVDDFKAFEGMGLGINYEEPEIDAQINDFESLVNVDFFVNSTKDGSEITLRSFEEIIVPLEIGRANDLVNVMVDKIYDDPVYIHVDAPEIQVFEDSFSMDATGFSSGSPLTHNLYIFEQKSRGSYERDHNDGKNFRYEFATLIN